MSLTLGGEVKSRWEGRRARSSPKPLRCSPCVVPWSPNTKRTGHMTCIYTELWVSTTMYIGDRELNVDFVFMFALSYLKSTIDLFFLFQYVNATPIGPSTVKVTTFLIHAFYHGQYDHYDNYSTVLKSTDFMSSISFTDNYELNT